jgi:hypothetical protein
LTMKTTSQPRSNNRNPNTYSRVVAYPRPTAGVTMKHLSHDRHFISVWTSDCSFLEYFNPRPSGSNVRIQNNFFVFKNYYISYLFPSGD